MTRWKPNTTVATVVARVNEQSETEYLLVHEVRDGKAVYNQPAGHLDEGEGLIAAAIRETLEETGWEVEVTGLIGIYRFVASNGITYMRHAFSARPIRHHKDLSLDDGIVEAVWMTRDQITTQHSKMRSTMVESTLDDYEGGGLYPLSLLHDPNA